MKVRKGTDEEEEEKEEKNGRFETKSWRCGRVNLSQKGNSLFRAHKPSELGLVPFRLRSWPFLGICSYTNPF